MDTDGKYIDGVWPPRLKAAEAKPEKGSHWKAGRDRRKDAVSAENDAKALVRKRDVKCRWPFCANCKTYKPRLEVAHLKAKGHGGDHGTRSTPDQMILLDHLTHQGGPDSLEQHGIEIEPLTSAGTDGPCAFWVLEDVLNLSTGEYERARLLWAKETAVGVLTSSQPLLKRRPARRAKETD
jgi:hypothetical protein